MPKQVVDQDTDPELVGRIVLDLGVNVFDAMVKGGGMIVEDIAGQGSLRAPIDEGDLRRSIYAEGSYIVAQMMGRTVLQFGVIAAEDYAAIQHQNTSFNHPRGGEAGYLTKPAKERKDKHMAIIQRLVHTAMVRTAAEDHS